MTLHPWSSNSQTDTLIIVSSWMTGGEHTVTKTFQRFIWRAEESSSVVV